MKCKNLNAYKYQLKVNKLEQNIYIIIDIILFL